MYKKLVPAFAIIVCLGNNTGYAGQQSEQIREDCESEVQAYGIVDPEEFEQLVSDCVASMNDETREEESEDFQFSDERT